MMNTIALGLTWTVLVGAICARALARRETRRRWLGIDHELMDKDLTYWRARAIEHGRMLDAEGNSVSLRGVEATASRVGTSAKRPLYFPPIVRGPYGE